MKVRKGGVYTFRAVGWESSKHRLARASARPFHVHPEYPPLQNGRSALNGVKICEGYILNGSL
jgi:hypothetical protein